MSEESPGFGWTILGWLVTAIFCFAGYGVFMAVRNYIHPATAAKAALPDYSAAHYRGNQQFAPLPANPREVILSVRTSWIPGDQKTGVLRYIVTVFEAKPTTDVADSAFLSSVDLCSMSVDLVDKQGFKLTTIPLKLTRIVDTNGNVTGLSDSDLMPMSRETYELISDSISPTWKCF